MASSICGNITHSGITHTIQAVVDTSVALAKKVCQVAQKVFKAIAAFPAKLVTSIKDKITSAREMREAAMAQVAQGKAEIRQRIHDALDLYRPTPTAWAGDEGKAYLQNLGYTYTEKTGTRPADDPYDFNATEEYTYTVVGKKSGYEAEYARQLLNSSEFGFYKGY